MIRLFKDVLIVYYMVGFFGIALFAVLIFKISFIYTIFLFIWVLVIKIIFNAIAIKKLGKINGIMHNACDVHEYIRIYEGFTKRWPDKKAKPPTIVLTNLACGYLNIKASNAAKETLDEMDFYKDNPAGAIYKVLYYLGVSTYYLQLGDLNNAARCLEELKQSLNNKKLSEMSRNKYFNVYNEKTFLLKLQEGQYEGAEQIFITKFERDKLMIDKVAAKYTLGQIYLHNNRMTEAQSAFGYAAEYGGSTYYAVESKAFLSQIN